MVSTRAEVDAGRAATSPDGSDATTDVEIVDGPRHAAAPPSWSSRVGGFAPFLVATVAYAVFVWRNSFVIKGRRTFSLFDDAMISMTYARNLAHGHGFVWNPGGPRVEGITNPLWALLMAGVQFVGFGDHLASLVVMIIGAGCLLGSAVLARLVVRDLAPDAGIARQVVAWLVLFDVALVWWTLRGMEVGLLTLLVFGAVYACQRSIDGSRAAAWWIGALIVAGESTRLDFLVFGVVFFAYLAWRSAPATRLRTLVIVGGLPAAGFVVQELARRAYYGAWVPNTYALKLGQIPLSMRLGRGRFVLEYGLLAEFGVVLAFAVVGLVLARNRRVRGGLLLTGAIFVSAAAYAMWVGGDAWEWTGFTNRYLTPGVAVLMVPAAFGVQYLVDRLPARGTDRAAPRFGAAAWALLAALVVLYALAKLLHPNLLELEFPRQRDIGTAALVAALVVVVYLAVRSIVRFGATSVERGVVAGVAAAAIVISAAYVPYLEWWRGTNIMIHDDATASQFGAELATITKPGARIAVTWAGAPIYFAHRTGVDLLGKSDPAIANRAPVKDTPYFYPGHMKHDVDISVFRYRPDVVAQYWVPRKGFFRRMLAAGYVLVHPKAPADPDATRFGRGANIMVLKGSPYVNWNLVDPSDVTALIARLPG